MEYVPLSSFGKNNLRTQDLSKDNIAVKESHIIVF